MSFWLKPTEHGVMYVNLDKIIYLHIQRIDDEFFVKAFYGAQESDYVHLDNFDSEKEAHKFIKEILCAGKDV